MASQFFQVSVSEPIFKFNSETEHYLKISEKAYIEQPLKHETEYEIKGVVTTTEDLQSHKKGQILTYSAIFTGNVELIEIRTGNLIKGKAKGSYSQRFRGRICGYAKDELGEIDTEAYYENFMKKAIRYVPELCEYLNSKS